MDRRKFGMKSILVAFVLVSAGVASVAGVSFGVPDGLTGGMPRLGAGTDDVTTNSLDEAPAALSKQSRVDMAQAQQAGQATGTGTEPTPVVEPADNRPVVDESALLCRPRRHRPAECGNRPAARALSYLDTAGKSARRAG
jgi:hypothetical protein